MADDRSVAELEAELADLVQRLELAGQALRADPYSRNADREHLALLRQVTPLERAVALARGEEAAVPIDWETPWDTGAPLPQVLASSGRTFLIYLAITPWPGGAAQSMPTTIDPVTPPPWRIALVEFLNCAALRFGRGSDDERGHALDGAGLVPYSAHTIANSRWLGAMREIGPYGVDDEPTWRPDLKHYLLMFHDDSFECLATGHRIEVFQDRLDGVLEIARQRFFSPPEQDG